MQFTRVQSILRNTVYPCEVQPRPDGGLRRRGGGGGEGRERALGGGQGHGGAQDRGGFIGLPSRSFKTAYFLNRKTRTVIEKCPRFKIF